MDADFGSLSDVFAAFFGETLFGQARGAGPRPARGPDVAAQVEIDLAEAARGISLDVGVRVARSCEACGGSGAAPGTSPSRAPAAAAPGVVQQVSRTVLGQIVRLGHVPALRRGGPIVETPCERCEGDGRTLEDVPLELDVPAGSTTASGSASAAPARRDARRPARATSTSRSASVRSRVSSVTATTSTSAPR